MVLAILILISAWLPLALTVIIETVLFATLLAMFSEEHRLAFAAKAILTTPLRYGSIALDVVVFARFLFDLAATRRGWRK